MGKGKCKQGSLRRKGKNEHWYKAHFLLVTKRKNRNVARSSRGRFQDVAALVQHQAKIEGSKPVHVRTKTVQRRMKVVPDA